MHTYHIPLPLEYFGEAEYEDVADDVSRVAHRQRRHQLVEDVLLPREPGDDGSIAHQAHTPDGNLQWAEDLFFPRVLNIFRSGRISSVYIVGCGLLLVTLFLNL